MQSITGRVFNVESKYITNPESSEFITIFRNQLDGKYYGRKSDGTDEPISADVPAPLYKNIVMKFREVAGEPQCIFYENNVNNTIDFVRQNTGRYAIVSEENVFDKDKLYTPGIIDGRASLIPISDTTDIIGYLYFRWRSLTELQLFVIDKLYQPINIENLIGDNWFNVPEIKFYNLP